MTSSDFKNIMENGFKAKYTGTDTDCRCFICGEKAELRDYIFFSKIVCVNNHQFSLIDWMVKHINMRDGVAKAFLNDECKFRKS